MYQPRKIEANQSWVEQDGIKIYTISAKNQLVNQEAYISRLNEVKSIKSIDWVNIPAFAIFHDGDPCKYLVLAWWGNDNELFTSVSVLTNMEWIEDPSKFSFCIWDLEVIWAERNIFVELMYCDNPNIKEYRAKKLGNS